VVRERREGGADSRVSHATLPGLSGAGGGEGGGGGGGGGNRPIHDRVYPLGDVHALDELFVFERDCDVAARDLSAGRELVRQRLPGSGAHLIRWRSRPW